MIEVNNLTNEKIDEKFLKKVAGVVLKGEQKISRYPNFELSIVLVGQKEIRALNKKYRNKDKATDVLSFKYLPALATPKALQAGDNIWGEVVICPEKTEDIARALVHGILHILGFNHKQMREDKYLTSFKHD